MGAYTKREFTVTELLYICTGIVDNYFSDRNYKSDDSGIWFDKEESANDIVNLMCDYFNVVLEVKPLKKGYGLFHFGEHVSGL